MIKTLFGLGIAVTLLLSGCTSNGSGTGMDPQGTPTSTTQSLRDNDVASVDLTESANRTQVNERRDMTGVIDTTDSMDLTDAMTMTRGTDAGDNDAMDRTASRDTTTGTRVAQLERKALQGNLAEQQLAALALERAENSKVKEAAKMIADDHKKAEVQLRNVAETNLPETVELTDEQQQMKARLQKLSSNEFDRAFIEVMITAHEKDLDFYKTQAEQASSEPLKGYFAQNARVIQRHLEHCRKLQNQMT